MKALHKLSNTEKGRLLADLFPDERAPMVCALLTEIERIRQDKSTFYKRWDNAMITADHWYSLASSAERLIDKLGYSMKRSSSVFSDQLFFGQLALFTVHCIMQYAVQQDSNPKFQLAVSLLFG